MANEAQVSIRFSTRDTETVKKALRDMGDEGARALSKLESLGSSPAKGLQVLNAAAIEVRGSFEGMVSSMGPIGAGLRALGPFGIAAGVGITAFASGLVKAVGEAAGAEVEMSKINAVLKATGNSAGLTANEIDDYTASLAQSTTATEGSLKSAAAQLMTFRSVSGDTFKSALAAAQDLAAVGFGGVEENAVKLGKALDDPLEGIDALAKAGVRFTAAQKEQIKVLEESGEHWKAQQFILDEVQRKVGGAGAAERDTMIGSWHSLTEATNQWFEETGKRTGVLPLLKSSFDSLAKSINDATAALSDEGQLAQLKSIAANPYLVASGQFPNLGADIKALEEKIATTNAYNAVLAKSVKIQGELAGAEKVRADQAGRTSAAIKKFTKEEQDRNAAAAKAAQEDSDRQSKAAQQREKTIMDMKAEADATQRKTDAMKVGGYVGDQLLYQMELEKALKKDVIGMTDDQIAQMITYADVIARNTVEQDKYNRKLREQEEAEREAQRVLEKAQDQFNDYYRDAVNLLQESLLDPMVDGWDGTLGTMADRFKRWLLAMAAEAALRPILVQGIAALGGYNVDNNGNVMGAGGQILSAASGLNSLSGAGGLFGANGAINTFGYNQLGIGRYTMAVDSEGVPTSFGMEGGLGSYFAGAGAGFAGYSLSNSLFKPRQGPGNEIGSAIGGGAGFALGGPLGAFVGSFIGGALGGLFGAHPSDKTELNDIQLEYGSVTQRDLGAGKDSPENRAAVDSLSQKILDFESILRGAGIQHNGDSLTLGAGTRDGNFRVVFNKDQKQGEEKFFDTAEEAAKYTIQKIIGNLDTIPPRFQKAIDNIDYDDLDGFVAEINRLKGVEDMMAGVRDQIEQIEDPLGYALKQLDKQFADMRTAVGDNAEDLVQIEKLYGLQRAEVVRQVNASIVSDTQAATDFVTEALRETAQMQMDSITAQMDGQKSVLAFFQNAKKTYAADLRQLQYGQYSIQTPAANLEDALAAYQKESALARLGNQDAVSDLRDYGFQLLDIAKTSVGATRYAEIQQMVSRDFQNIADLSDRQSDIAQQQLDVEQQQLDELRRISGIGANGQPVSSTFTSAADLDALNAQGGQLYNAAHAQGQTDAEFVASAGFNLLQQTLFRLYGGLNDVGRLVQDYRANSDAANNGSAFAAANAQNAAVIAQQLAHLVDVSKGTAFEAGMTNAQMDALRAQIAQFTSVIQGILDRMPRAA